MKLAATLITLFLISAHSFAQKVDRSFSFQKITFSASAGMAIGNYHKIQIDIDSTGKMYFSCLPGKVKKTGTYKGQLTHTQLEKLNDLIYNSEPDQYAVPDTRIMLDVATRGFKVWYRYKNNKAMSQGVSPKTPPLESYMYSLIDTVPLEKASNDFGQTVSDD